VVLCGKWLDIIAAVTNSSRETAPYEAPRHETAPQETARQVSQTALTAAAARAAHLIVDHEPVIFADTLAADLLGDKADELIGYHRLHGSHLVLACARAQVTCRSRYTEQAVTDGLARGVAQYVLLGAGLDTFAYRSALAGRISVFEVDEPATQGWKRKQLAAAGLAAPPSTRYVPVDFELDSLTSRLVAAGFDLAAPALVSWLGVTMYLTQDAIGAVVAEVGRFASGTELILDYMLPAELRDEIGNSYVEQVAPAFAQRGEPWLSFFSPGQMTALLEGHGFAGVRHIAQRYVGTDAMWQRTDMLRPSYLSKLAHAWLAA
jgi:methyltransferase (TIGR00027 family)